MDVCPYSYQLCKDPSRCPARVPANTMERYRRRIEIAERCIHAGVRTRPLEWHMSLQNEEVPNGAKPDAPEDD